MSTNYQMTSYFGNDVILLLWRQTATTSTIPRSWYVSFNRHPSSIFSFKIWVHYEVKKQLSNFEFVKRPGESSLRVFSVL